MRAAMGRYHAILFDMDGTLLDTLTDMQDAVNHVLADCLCGPVRRCGASWETAPGR